MNPQEKAFTEAVQALYPSCLWHKRFMQKDGRDFAVAKLEGLWWVKFNKPASEVPAKNGIETAYSSPDFVTS